MCRKTWKDVVKTQVQLTEELAWYRLMMPMLSLRNLTQAIDASTSCLSRSP